MSNDKAQLHYVCVHTSDVSKHCKCGLLTGTNAHLSSDYVMTGTSALVRSCN